MSVLAVALLVACGRDGSSRGTGPDRSSKAIGTVSLGPVTAYVDADAWRLLEELGETPDRLLEDVVEPVRSLLPLPETEVVVQVAPEHAVGKYGIGGFTDPKAGRVYISLDDGFRDLGASIEGLFDRLLAHELHHALRIIEGPGYGKTVGEEVITEGLADVFVTEAFPDEGPLSVAVDLSGAELDEVFRVFRREVDRRYGRSGHARWFYGSAELPPNAGYSLGFDLVKRYIDEKGRSAGEMVLVPAGVILEEFV